MAITPILIQGKHTLRDNLSILRNTIRCQEVPTVNVDINEIQGDWYLQEYVNSHDGKPIGANQPYLCPESRMQVVPNTAEKVNIAILYISLNLNRY